MMSMAHGLEVRVPFLDHKLVELAMSIPENIKLIEPYAKLFRPTAETSTSYSITISLVSFK